MSSVYLITGIMAAGKSTVAQALAERLPKAAHVRGDTFRKAVVSGRAEPVPGSDEGMAQLRLRYRIAAGVADQYAAAAREAGRGETGYGAWTVAELDTSLRTETPRLGLWLDTSDLTPEQTVEAILARRDQAAVT